MLLSVTWKVSRELPGVGGAGGWWSPVKGPLGVMTPSEFISGVSVLGALACGHDHSLVSTLGAGLLIANTGCGW